MADATRQSPTYVATLRFSDFEQDMAAVYGERFLRYRQDYYRNIAVAETGFVPEFPITLQVELINRCNLKCQMCWTTNHTLPKATLEMPVIRRMLEEGKDYGLPALVLGMGAEALLYKPILELVDTALANGVMDIFFASNGILMTEEVSEYLVANKISRCWVSLDAATPETFRKIRGKDELARIEANILKLAEIKRRENSALPNLRVSFVVQPENRHEVQAFVDKWQGVVDHIDFQQEIDFHNIEGQTEIGNLDALPVVEGAIENPKCHYPFGTLNVWANGDVTPCCVFYGRHLVIGNANEQSLKAIWDGEKMAAVRRQFTGEAPLNRVCHLCLSSRDKAGFDAVKEVVGQTDTGHSATQ